MGAVDIFRRRMASRHWHGSVAPRTMSSLAPKAPVVVKNSFAALDEDLIMNQDGQKVNFHKNLGDVMKLKTRKPRGRKGTISATSSSKRTRTSPTVGPTTPNVEDAGARLVNMHDYIPAARRADVGGQERFGRRYASPSEGVLGS